MIHFLALTLFLQILNPLAGQLAYTTPHPNPESEQQIGLATLSGRYAITLVQNCDDIKIGENILIYPAFQLPPWLTISSPDGSSAGGCIVRIDGQMDPTPCFSGDDGQCDVNVENPI